MRTTKISNITILFNFSLQKNWYQVKNNLSYNIPYFQHLVWILGLKPSAGGSLKASQQISDSSNAVITTAVMSDLPVLASMLSRLFESSQYDFFEMYFGGDGGGVIVSGLGRDELFFFFFIMISSHMKRAHSRLWLWFIMQSYPSFIQSLNNWLCTPQISGWTFHHKLEIWMNC